MYHKPLKFTYITYAAEFLKHVDDYMFFRSLMVIIRLHCLDVRTNFHEHSKAEIEISFKPGSYKGESLTGKD